MTTATTRSTPSLTFHGAAGTVTGSRHLLDLGVSRILLDAGLFQGGRELRARNWNHPAFDIASLDAIVLSHAHLDHSGYLPVLARNGLRAPIHCTAGTRDVLGVLLADAAGLQEEEARHANRKGWSRHKPALPLFCARDVERVMKLVRVHRYGDAFDVRGARVILRPAGHIVGSSTVDVTIESTGTRVVFTGDLGRYDQPILVDPEPVEDADVLLLESTYGDREHTKDAKTELARVVSAAHARGGALLIPAFAVGRAQTLIWMLRELEHEGRIAHVPVYIDSPMANRIAEVTCRHTADLDADMLRKMDERECPLCCKRYVLCETPEQSKAINRVSGPIIVIAGSGMATGGRILHHFLNRLGDSRTTVLLAGYQAEGTRGRLLRDGVSALQIFGREVAVRSAVEQIDGLSAHADRTEIVRWLGGFRRPPRMTYIVHGEAASAAALAGLLHERLRMRARPARDGEWVALVDVEANGE